MKNSQHHQPARPALPLSLLALGASLLLTGCLATAPTLGENKGVVSGSAGGEATTNANKQLEKCEESLGTLALTEDTQAPWFMQLSQYNLGPTLPVIRLMIQQSNCFVIVDRSAAMRNMQQERDLQRSGEMRSNSNFGGGQMVSADYSLSPAVQFSGKTGGGGGMGFGGALGMLSVVAASASVNEASTTLLLVDNRSGVQISASEGTAKNMDFGVFGGLFGGAGGGAGGAYAKTPQGKVVVAAFADSFNQMIKSLRNYKAQTVKGGLGTGGRLTVDGGVNPNAAPAPAPAPKAQAPANAPAKPARKPVAAKPAEKSTGG